ncbi:hypothetical protein PCC7424_0103 [Gloeothece citriformis PCC 7424]|uniref:Uncharacterized protein n=1 Tax=Gloeothece citriformis (strain PCC 7424) TaxID=65393 RepID=B7K990_GLOC7|nr:hypothetical protein [Gloeothece citriformis]ACK68573.1 hypothetical protein PCC7424_0103 [Gloeothece citriformis PCC 7424]
MNQVSLLHQAKQGDSQAIADLLNQSLRYKNAEIVKATLEDNCLQLKLQSKHTTPNKHKLIPFIKEEITSLRLEIVEQLKISAFVAGVEEAAWETTLILEEHTQRIAEFSHILSAKSDDLEPEEISLELRAKRGDPTAILELLSQVIKPESITVKLRLNKNYLQVLIMTDQELDQDNIVSLIENKLIETRLPLIKQVTIYAKHPQEDIPLWHESFGLSSQSSKKSNPEPENESPSLFNKLLNFKKS